MQRRRQLIGATVAAVVVVAVVLIIVLLRGSGTPMATPSAGASSTPSPSSSATATPTPSPSKRRPSPTPACPPGGPVPAGFSAVSVTFISTSTGWVLRNAPCTKPPCTSMLRTRDGGATWQGVPAPPVPLPTGGAPAEVRFADAANGWVSAGAQLEATHDGGAHWSPVTLPGLRPDGDIEVLATSAGTVDAWVQQSGAPSGPNPSALYHAAAGGDSWSVTTVTAPDGVAASFSLSGTTGWLVAGNKPYRTTDGSRWEARASPCPAQTTLAVAVANGGTAYATCTGNASLGGGTVQRSVMVSRDGGATFSRSADPPQTGDLAGVTAAPDGRTLAIGVESGDGSEIQLSRDGGASYTTPYRATASQAGSLVDLGFTTTTQGVVIAQGDQGALLMTRDGGVTWRAVAF